VQRLPNPTIESVTLTLSEPEAGALLAVLDADGDIGQVRRVNQAVYAVLRALEEALGY
jgi:hypothetical protein